MTYYDTRIHPEQSDKRRHREKAHSNASDGMSSASGARQLGPREIKRRPLPPGPGQPQVNEMPAPLNIQPRQLQPSQTHGHPQYAPQQQQQWMSPETPEDFGYSQPAPSQYDQYHTPDGHYDDFRQLQGPESVQHEHDYFDQPGDTFMPLYDAQAPQPTPPRTSYNDMPNGGSPHSHPSSPYTPQHSSPPVQQSPPSLPQDAYRENRMSMSPTKHMPHRDSPLRQSISQQEVQLVPTRFEPDFDEVEPPPPPPAHRGSLPRPGGPTAFSTPPHDRQSRQPPRQTSIDDRSPLQMLEHQYNPHTPSPHRSSARLPQPQEKPMPFLPVEVAVAGDFPAPHQLSMNYGVDFVTEPVEQDQEGRYIRRNSANSAVERPDFQVTSQRSQTFDAANAFDERNTFRSEPRLVRPRAVSPNEGPAVPRKSVSPNPYPSNDRSRMGVIPFGPDSYDVLNPGSSPTSHGHPTPERSREVARQEEVDKIRAQGPIIGNDGRVIDPSDHLPSDTWAPEPERKNRKPEHVIHVRRKNEQQRPDSSPLPIKPLSKSNSPFQGPSQTPIKPLSASSSPYRSPGDSIPVPDTGRRNRLQKQMPQRPLPTQPFVHPHSSPSAIPQVRSSNQPSPSQQRSSMPSSPMAGPPQRPPLSDYQVPVVGNYNPRNSYHPQQHQSTPPRMPPMQQRPQSFAYGGYDDPLAAELSMIDIGPPRSGGRTVLRPNRGYSGY